MCLLCVIIEEQVVYCVFTISIVEVLFTRARKAEKGKEQWGKWRDWGEGIKVAFKGKGIGIQESLKLCSFHSISLFPTSDIPPFSPLNNSLNSLHHLLLGSFFNSSPVLLPLHFPFQYLLYFLSFYWHLPCLKALQ